jgi:hypothetical protein
MLSLTIGIDAGININEVFFMPSVVGADLKIYSDRAATLHTFIPEKTWIKNCQRICQKILAFISGV